MTQPLMLLDLGVLAVSFFNTITLFWLGLMVLLNGNRRVWGTWVTGGGMLLGAIFFTSHTAIMGKGLASTSMWSNFWWWVSWAPAIIVPPAWYGAMLWYTGFRFDRSYPHRLGPVVVGIITVIIVLLLIFANPLPSYQYIARRLILVTPGVFGFPLLILVYLIYSLFCYGLPLDLLRREPANLRPLEGMVRRRARPWLVAASLALLGAGVAMTVTALWLIYAPMPDPYPPYYITFQVKRFDLVVETLVALAIICLGRAIIVYEVFTERPLPRQGLFVQWWNTLLLAAGYGALVAWMLVISLGPLYCLMLATMLMALFYALYGWRIFTERDHFMSRLRPFIASQDLYDQLLDTVPREAASPQLLFQTFCREVLNTQAATLVPAGTLMPLTGPPLHYPAKGERIKVNGIETLVARFTVSAERCVPTEGHGAVWAVSLWTGRGLGGILFLGAKTDGRLYSAEEIEIAQAGGERLLDALAGVEIARLALDLVRQRQAQIRLVEGQGRRVLHDDVLPALHTAILYLNGEPEPSEPAQQTVELLVQTHRRVSDLMRDVLPAAPHRLAQQGLVAALRALLDDELAGAFTGVTWQMSPEARAAVPRLSSVIAEGIFFAARELLRNAARYGRGGDSQRALRLALIFEAGTEFSLAVLDDGAGLSAETVLGSGSGQGLRLHSALLATVGGSLEVGSRPEGGTRGVIRVPLAGSHEEGSGER